MLPNGTSTPANQPAARYVAQWDARTSKPACCPVCCPMGRPHQQTSLLPGMLPSGTPAPANPPAARHVAQWDGRTDRQTTQTQPAIDRYDAVSTFHNDDFCKARLPMLCTSCLELTTENCR